VAVAVTRVVEAVVEAVTRVVVVVVATRVVVVVALKGSSHAHSNQFIYSFFLIHH
jgi:hypothetical protein